MVREDIEVHGSVKSAFIGTMASSSKCLLPQSHSKSAKVVEFKWMTIRIAGDRELADCYSLVKGAHGCRPVQRIEETRVHALPKF